MAAWTCTVSLTTLGVADLLYVLAQIVSICGSSLLNFEFIWFVVSMQQAEHKLVLHYSL